MDWITIILFFGLAASLGYNLWQSIRADQMNGQIERLRREREE